MFAVHKLNAYWSNSNAQYTIMYTVYAHVLK